MKQKRVIFTIVIVALISINIAMVSQNVMGRIIDPEIPPSTTHSFICKGYVKTSSGAAISGATVVVRGGDPDVGIYKSTTTSSTGYYYISLQTSLYTYCSLTASKSGYTSQTKSVYSSGIRINDFSLAIAPHTFICKGYVTNYLGTKLAGAVVTVTGSGISGSDTADSNGYYYISKPTTSYVTCTVKATHNGYLDKSTTVTSSGTNSIDFVLTLEPWTFTYTGIVRDQYGNRVYNAKVRIYGIDFDKSVYTNSNGEYSVTASTSVFNYGHVTVSKSGYETTETDIYTSAGSHNLNLVIDRIYTDFTVTDTIHLGVFAPFPWVYRDFFLAVTTTYTESIYNDEFIKSQSLHLYSSDSWIAPSEETTFTVSYSDGSSYYWKAYSPDVYDNGYLRITSPDAHDYDSFSGIYGTTSTILVMHLYYTYNGNYVDLGSKTHEFNL